MVKEQMKNVLRGILPNYQPSQESLLDVAINESAQVVWDKTQWSFKKAFSSFVSDGSETYDMEDNIDSILEITYGATNRVIYPKLSGEINDLYNNANRTGDICYFYSLFSADENVLTIEFTPPIPTGDTVSIKSLIKKSYDNIDAIPSKLHGIVLRGAVNFLQTGGVYGNQDFGFMLDAAVLADKPIIHKRTSMGRDALQNNRTNAIASVGLGGYSQDTAHPID